MRLAVRWHLCLLVFSCMFSASAAAQLDYGLHQMELTVGGRVLGYGPALAVGAGYCAPGVEARLRVAGYHEPNGINALEFWATRDYAVDCSQASSRTLTSTSVPRCWQLGTARSVTISGSLRFDALSLFKNPFQDDSNSCPDGAAFDVTVFAVPLDTPTSANPSNPPEPIQSIPVGTLRVTLDSTIPEAPTRLSEHSTSSVLQVSWEPTESDTWFDAYWDTSVGDDDSCSTTVLQAGDPAPQPDNAFLHVTSTQGVRASLFHLLERGVEYGDSVAVAVVQRDLAGNVSPLSEVLCLQPAPMEDWPSPPLPVCPKKSGACSVRGGGAASRDVLACAALGLVLLASVGRRGWFAYVRGPRR